MTEEHWLPVVGFPDYEVSDFGRVRRLAGRDIRGNFVNPHFLKLSGKRPYARMSRDGKKYQVRVSIIVLTAFVCDKPFPKAEARHLNDVSTDDRLFNLAWGTSKDNKADAIRNGRMPRGDKNGSAKLTTEDVIDFIREYRYRGKNGNNLSAFAKKFGVSTDELSLILRGRRWRHITRGVHVSRN